MQVEYIKCQPFDDRLYPLTGRGHGQVTRLKIRSNDIFGIR